MLLNNSHNSIVCRAFVSSSCRWRVHRKFLNYSMCRCFSVNEKELLYEKRSGNEISYDDRRDYVFVDDLIFHGYHGDLQEEKVLGQKFIISLKLYPTSKKLIKCANSDLLKDTMDYTVIINEIEEIMKSTSFDMIEKLGNEIARHAFKVYESDKLEAIQIKITKPNVCIPQNSKGVGVNIFRTVGDFK